MIALENKVKNEVTSVRMFSICKQWKMIARILHFECATTDLEAENDHRANIGKMSDNTVFWLILNSSCQNFTYNSSFPGNCHMFCEEKKMGTWGRY